MTNEIVKRIKSTYTKEFIQEKLMTEVRWVERSLVKLYERQTRDEQISRETICENGIGFNSSDSRYLTYCSQWILKGNPLNEKHFIKCGSKLKKYWRQIQECIVEHNS
jgi:hypothetical protein